MTYKEARNYIDGTIVLGSCMGLDSIKELMHRLGDPQDSIKTVHVAGTNGKGSVIAYVSSVLSEAGYQVGKYTSPSVFGYLEKFQICDKEISEDVFTLAAEKVIEKAGEMVKDGMPHPTSFELETAIAFTCFAQQKCDFVLLETGLGGTLDATNIIKAPICSVITSISIDHADFLGDTIEKIAENKAGIIKEGCPVILYGQSLEVLDVISGRAAKKNAGLTVADAGRIKILSVDAEGLQTFTYKTAGGKTYEITIGMRGTFQISNAITALEVIEEIGRFSKIDQAAIQSGFKNARWRGRFEQISENPRIFIDGAHNPDAAYKLADTVKSLVGQPGERKKKVIFIMGIFADKDYRSVISITAPLADKIYAVASDNSRALDKEMLAAEIRKINPNVEAMEIRDAITSARREAIESETIIVAFGTLSMLGELAEIVEETRK